MKPLFRATLAAALHGFLTDFLPCQSGRREDCPPGSHTT